MSAPYIIPFNHQPISTGVGSSTYTVPSGKYTRLVVAVHTSAYGNVSQANQRVESMSNDSNTVTQAYWLKAGDVVTVSTTSASASASPSTGATSFLRSSSIASVLINGSTVIDSESYSHIEINNANTSVTVSISGNSSARYFYEEYNVIS
jgi:hypothetical protein